jgi:hypothetical protein
MPLPTWPSQVLGTHAQPPWTHWMLGLFGSTGQLHMSEPPHPSSKVPHTPSDEPASLGTVLQVYGLPLGVLHWQMPAPASLPAHGAPLQRQVKPGLQAQTIAGSQSGEAWVLLHSRIAQMGGGVQHWGPLHCFGASHPLHEIGLVGMHGFATTAHVSAGVDAHRPAGTWQQVPGVPGTAAIPGAPVALSTHSSAPLQLTSTVPPHPSGSPEPHCPFAPYVAASIVGVQHRPLSSHSPPSGHAPHCSGSPVHWLRSVPHWTPRATHSAGVNGGSHWLASPATPHA